MLLKRDLQGLELDTHTCSIIIKSKLIIISTPLHLLVQNDDERKWIDVLNGCLLSIYMHQNIKTNRPNSQVSMIACMHVHSSYQELLGTV